MAKGKKLKPKVRKEVEIGAHNRVGRKEITTVESHMREMEVSVKKSDMKQDDVDNKMTPDDKREAKVNDMNKKFREADNSENDFSHYEKDFGSSKQIAGLDSHELDVMEDYIKEIGFNSKLRDNIADGNMDDPDVKAMDSMTDKAEPLQKDTLAYRGNRHDIHDTLGRELKVGEVFQDKGFMSLTTKPDVATNFMWNHDMDTGEMEFGTFYQVDMPKGTKAFPINKAERELLLQRDMNFEVLSNKVVDMDFDAGAAQVPKLLKEYTKSGFDPYWQGYGQDADTGGAVSGGTSQASKNANKIRVIHLKALPGEGQKGTPKRETMKPRKTVIRRKKKK